MVLPIAAGGLAARSASAQCPRYEVYAEIDAASCNATLYIRGWSPKNDYICGGIKCGSGDLHAFVWWGEGGLDILPMPAGTVHAEAFDVNDAGIVVGRVGVLGSGFSDQAFRYDRATKQVSLLPPPADANASVATSITEAGLIAGHFIPGHGFLWLWDTDTVVSIEPMLEGVGYASQIEELTDSGYITGLYYLPGSDTRRAFRISLSEDEFESIPISPETVHQRAAGVNAVGLVVGTRTLSEPDLPAGFRNTAFSWDGESVVLFEPPSAFLQSRSLAVCDDGTSTIEVDNVFNGNTSAVGRDGRVFLLENLVVDPPSPRMQLPWTMHPDGRIATYSVAFGNDADLVLLRPIEPVLGDATCDGRVGFDDLVDVLAAWSRCDDGFADVDRSGCVDLTDLELVIAAWDGG